MSPSGNYTETFLPLGKKVEDLIKELLRLEEVDLHSVVHRIKTQESIDRKKQSKSVGLDKIHDLLGVRVITHFADEVDICARVIEREFDVDFANSVDKRALLDPDRFGYLSRHYVVSLSSNRLALTENRGFEGLKFEIQVRSILQHAWAEIEHDLGYKSKVELPAQISRRFFRVAGILEIADDEFQAIRDDIASYKSELPEKIESTPSSVLIDTESVLVLIALEDVYEADRLIANAIGIDLAFLSGELGTRLPKHLNFVGFNTIDEVVKALRSSFSDTIKFAVAWRKRLPAERLIKRADRGISLFYLCYVVLAKTGDVALIEEYLDRMGVGPGEEAAEHASGVLSAWREVVDSEQL